MRNFLREEDGEAALSNRVLVPGTASIGINIGIDWYSKYWTNIFNTFRDPYLPFRDLSCDPVEFELALGLHKRVSELREAPQSVPPNAALAAPLGARTPTSNASAHLGG